MRQARSLDETSSTFYSLPTDGPTGMYRRRYSPSSSSDAEWKAICLHHSWPLSRAYMGYICGKDVNIICCDNTSLKLDDFVWHSVDPIDRSLHAISGQAVREAICLDLQVKHPNAACHVETNCQARCSKKTRIAWLRDHGSDHQKDWGQYVRPLARAYSAQVHRSAKTVSFRKAPSRQLLLLPAMVPRKRILSDAYCDVPPWALRIHLLTPMEYLKKMWKNWCPSHNVDTWRILVRVSESYWHLK